MNRAVVVIAGGAISPTPHMTDSWRDAATRWDATLFVRTEKLDDELPWMAQSLLVPRWARETGLGEVVCLDADLLVRADCPSPFDFLGVDEAAFAAREDDVHLLNDNAEVTRQRLEAIAATPDNTGYFPFNTGVSVWNVERVAEWYDMMADDLRAMNDRERVFHWCDQLLVNRVCARGWFNAARLPKGMNAIIKHHSSRWVSRELFADVMAGPRMVWPIQHLVGRLPWAKKVEILERWDWRLT